MLVIQELTQKIDKQRTRCFYCLRDGVIIGHVFADTYKGSKGLWLHSLYVKKSERGNGKPAVMLMNAVKAYGIRKGKTAITGTVHKNNKYARKIYDKCGAVDIYETGDNIGLTITLGADNGT